MNAHVVGATDSIELDRLQSVIRELLSKCGAATTWIRHQRRRGVPLARVLFLDFPTRALFSAYRRIAGVLNLYVLHRLVNTAAFARFQGDHDTRTGGHFYIIVMPNTLHFLRASLSLLPSHVSVFLISNGARRWEQDYLRTMEPERPVFTLRLLPRSHLPHGTVLSMLFEGNQKNFGIIDSDLFIFDARLFEQLNFQGNEFVLGVFEVANRRLNLRFPSTHFMFFNVPIVKRIIDEYGIDASETKNVPSRLRGKLSMLGLGKKNFLKSHLNYYDTFNLINAVAIGENLSFRTLNFEAGDVVHVGKTSYYHSGRVGLDERYLFVAYVSLRLLEIPFNRPLQSRYRLLFPPFRRPEEVLEQFPESPAARKLIEDADALVERLQDPAV